jgi:hypothetical protein
VNAPYRVPGLLALTTLVGLVLALLAEGVWDVLSWGLLVIPVAALAVRLIRPRGRLPGRRRASAVDRRPAGQAPPDRGG